MFKKNFKKETACYLEASVLPSNHYSPSLTSRPDLLCVFLSLLHGLAFALVMLVIPTAVEYSLCEDTTYLSTSQSMHIWVISTLWLLHIVLQWAIGHTAFGQHMGSHNALLSFSFLKRCIYFFYFWLWGVFAVACGPFLSCRERGLLPVVVRWLLLWATGSRAHGLCSCSSWALEQQAE